MYFLSYVLCVLFVKLMPLNLRIFIIAVNAEYITLWSIQGLSSYKVKQTFCAFVRFYIFLCVGQKAL